MVSNSRRIALGSLFGVSILAIIGPFPSPTSDYLIGFQAFFPVLRARDANDLAERRRGILEPVAAQLSCELLERVAPGDERAAEAFAAEAPDDARADAGPSPDQQEVTRVN